MGPKTFEQAAGFLRIHGSGNPLDASAVHPERYPIVEAMARDCNCTVKDLMEQEGLQRQIDAQRYISDTVGLPTLRDILGELAKPGRDPRQEFELFSFTEGVNGISDLEVGMQLPGVITNVTAFGAFVDIGVHQDGLVHISVLADKYVKNPHDVVKVNQKVTVTVIAIDLDRKRISLSMRRDPFQDHPRGRGGGGDRGKPAASDTSRASKKRKPRPPQSQLAQALDTWKKRQ